jgi:hypothetical protein
MPRGRSRGADVHGDQRQAGYGERSFRIGTCACCCRSSLCAVE